jgi:stearoyl-CoA desaturase (delta-9 desaturase)
LFSWSGVAWAIFGLTLFGTLGVNIGFHRLLTHRGFECPRWLEHALAVLGVCCMQGSPISWVAIHRKHHQHSDDADDPHSPRTGFFWSHIGWFLVIDSAIYNFDTYNRYARDLFQDRFYKQLERPQNVRKILLAQWAIFFCLGALVGGFLEGTILGALQLGLSWLAWGVVFRTVAVWHITWSVNSLTHIWGYRNYSTGDDSKKNWLVGIVSNGEGWHNNHHAEPRSAAHGHRWWEFDLSYEIIHLLEMVGLAWKVVRPTQTQPTLPMPEPKAEPAAEQKKRAA